MLQDDAYAKSDASWATQLYTREIEGLSAATLRTYEQDTVTAMNTVGRYMMQTVIVLELVDWIVHIGHSNSA